MTYLHRLKQNFRDLPGLSGQPGFWLLGLYGCVIGGGMLGFLVWCYARATKGDTGAFYLLGGMVILILVVQTFLIERLFSGRIDQTELIRGLTGQIDELEHKLRDTLTKSVKSERAVNLERRRTSTLERDALTGALRKEAGEKEIAKAMLNPACCQSLAIAVIDIDHFKSFNDRFGHAAGDQVLQAVGNTIRAQLRTDDIFCRWGGEEFLVAVSGLDPGTFEQLVLRLLAAVSRIEITSGTTRVDRISFSAGLARMAETDCSGLHQSSPGAHPRAISTQDPLLGFARTILSRAFQLADQRLYQAKQAGRNRICTG